jgi:hypothetical protein
MRDKIITYCIHWVTGWTMGDSNPCRGLGIFLFTTTSRTALGPIQPPIQWVAGALSLGVKWPGREADHSPPSSAEVKNAWSYTSTPPYTFMAWCSVTAQGQLLTLLNAHKSFEDVAKFKYLDMAVTYQN